MGWRQENEQEGGITSKNELHIAGIISIIVNKIGCLACIEAYAVTDKGFIDVEKGEIIDPVLEVIA